MRNHYTDWQQRGLDAVKEMLNVDGRQRKEMIEFLFDSGLWDRRTLKSWEAAEARWNDCLNPKKPAFWKVTELWALMRRFGRHHVFLALADDLEYDVRRRPTDERLQDLLEQTLAKLESTEAELALHRERLSLAFQEHGETFFAARPSTRIARFRKDGPEDEASSGAGLF